MRGAQHHHNSRQRIAEVRGDAQHNVARDTTRSLVTRDFVATCSLAILPSPRPTTLGSVER